MIIEKEWRQIEKLPLFAGIHREGIRHIISCLKGCQKEYNQSEIVSLSENCIGIVLSGRIHMLKREPEGKDTVFVVIKENEVFGENYVFGKGIGEDVFFEAVTDTEILFISGEKIMHTCSGECGFHQQLVENMLGLVVEKNIQLVEKIEIISKKTIREKILAYLKSQTIQSECKYITIPLGRMELAEYLCVNRSALTRELTQMKREGILDFERNTFRILK